MAVLAQVALDIRELARSFEHVVLHLGVDGAATCELTVDYVREMVSDLENVVVVNHSFCLMHGLNRVTSDHCTKSAHFDFNRLFQFVKMLHIGKYFDTKKLLQERLRRRPRWIRCGCNTATYQIRTWSLA